MNDQVLMWLFAGLTASCGAGFLLLLRRADLNTGMINARPTYKEVSDEYAKKEIVRLQFEKIENTVGQIKDSFKQVESDSREISKGINNINLILANNKIYKAND